MNLAMIHLALPLLPFVVMLSYAGLVLAQDATDSQNFSTYNNPIFNMSVKYPQDWLLDGQDRILDDKVIGGYNFAVGCPKELVNKTVEFILLSQCYHSDSELLLSIWVNNLPPNMTLNEFVTSSLAQDKLEKTDFKITNLTTDDTLSAIPAYSIEYTWKQNPALESFSYSHMVTIEVYEVFAVKDERGYAVTYRAL